MSTTYTITASYAARYTSGAGQYNWNSNLSGSWAATDAVWAGRNGSNDYNQYGVYAFNSSSLTAISEKIANGATITSVTFRFNSNANNGTMAGSTFRLGLRSSSSQGSGSSSACSTTKTFAELGLSSIPTGWNTMDITSYTTSISQFINGFTIGAASGTALNVLKYFGTGSNIAQLIIILEEDSSLVSFTTSLSNLTNYAIYSEKAVSNIHGVGTTREAAFNDALQNVKNQGYSTTYNQYTSFTDKYLGIYHAPVVTSTTYSTTPDADHPYMCTMAATNRRYLEEVYIPFTPSERVTASNLKTASISYTVATGTYMTIDCYICAPATSSSSISQYAHADNAVFYSVKGTLVHSTTPGATYSIPVTNQLRQALRTGNYWLVLVLQDPSASLAINNNVQIISDIVFTCIIDDTLKTWIKVNGDWMKATPYIKVNSVWKEAIAWVNVSGTWKQV